MRFKHNKFTASMLHKVAADYRLKVPAYFNLLALIGIGLTVLGISLILQNGITIVSVISIIAGIILIVPRFALAILLPRFQDVRFHIRDAIVQNVDWRGDESVLDVGVGSGLTLFGCAKQLKSGKAIGIDVFHENSGGGTAETFWQNATHEGLKERVDLKFADARDMPFDDSSFDVIVSTSAFHHMGGAESRQKAAQEVIRVLKPGGQVLIYDLSIVLKELESAMREAGFSNIERRGGGTSALMLGQKSA